MSNKGAIELSVNFFVVIIISMVILVGGLTLFYKMIDQTKQLADTLDQQTEMKIKDMMLSGNLPVLAYPQDTVVENEKMQLIGVGVTNNLQTTTKFHINVTKIVKYPKGSTNGIALPAPQFIDYHSISGVFLDVKNGDRQVKSIVLKMPKNATSAQYVYTVNVSSVETGNVYRPYGVIQVYVTNP